MDFDKDETLDISEIDLTDEADTELKKLSLEEEAMKVLTRVAREHGLSEEDDDLILQIYQEAVAAHDNDKNDTDAPTAGRKLFEQISSETYGEGSEK